MTPEQCPYCQSPVELKPDTYVYGRTYGANLYVCSRFPDCDAYVGCHKGTVNALGRLANKELRMWKNKAHSAFDPKWKYDGLPRDRAYEWLSKQLKLTRDECHIGMFDVDMCKKVVEVCK